MFGEHFFHVVKVVGFAEGFAGFYFGECLVIPAETDIQGLFEPGDDVGDISVPAIDLQGSVDTIGELDEVAFAACPFQRLTFLSYDKGQGVV